MNKPDYSALFTASPYPYLLIDPGFIIIGANPAYLQATGRTFDDIVGKHIFDAFPANPADPASTNLDEVHGSIERAIATGRPHTSALLRYALPRAKPGGTVFDERYWSAIHTPVFDAAGAVAFVVQNAIDVTELYRFDAGTKKYYLKQDASAVSDLAHLNRPQMHEAMTRILNAERSQLQILFNQAPGFIAVLSGAEHTFEMANEAYYELVGYRDIVGKPAFEALPELAGQGLRELLDTAYQTGEPSVLRERRITLQRTRGGPLEERYVDLLYQPVRGTDGRVTGIFAQGNDVTGAYQTKCALSEKIAQLEQAQAHQAFQLELADRIRQLSDPNDVTAAACELLGRRIGASQVLYAEVDHEGKTASIRRDWTVAGTASMAGQTRALEDFGPALVAQLRCGQTIVNNDVALDASSAPYMAAYKGIGVRAMLLVPMIKAGKLCAVLTIHHAIARTWQELEVRLAHEVAERAWSAVESAQAQAALRAERDRSQYIFDSMGEGFAVLDRNWTILRMNAEGLRLTQKTAAKVIGGNHWDIFPALKGTDTEAAYHRVMQSGKTEFLEISYTWPDQTHSWMEIRAHGSVDGGIAFFFRDVTERRLAQEQLTIADRRKDEFLAMLAHELRNPLAPIGAAAQVLQWGELDDARVRQTSQVIGRQVEHMTHLIDDLLDVSRVTRGLITLDTAPHDIRQMVAEAVEQVTPLIQSRRQHLALHLPPDTTMVDGDQKRLVQVITNILNNAAKYTSEGGSIVLTTHVHAERVLVQITDDGIGMAPDLVAHAFDLFAQAERSSDRSAGGLGLGLALVKSLIELHAGTVQCSSPGIGKGSTFTVCLPRLSIPERQELGLHQENLVEPGPKALRILLVDDNVDAASMLAMLLESCGHSVMVEYGGREGLARATAERPDVCLLDIGLPGLDGIELARCLRRLPQTAGAVLIAATGYGQESDRERTRSAGFDHHLVKPLDLKHLFSILEQLTGI